MFAFKKYYLEVLPVIAAVVFGLSLNIAYADFEIIDVEPYSEDGILQVNANAALDLTAETQNALESGVDLRIQFLIQLVKNRNWIWDKPMNEWEMLFTLHFHQLSGQYILATPQSDAIRTFNTSERALNALASQLSFNVGYVEALKLENDLYLRVRIRLDTAFLPAPLKLFSLVSRDWKLDSGWKEWALDQ